MPDRPGFTDRCRGVRGTFRVFVAGSLLVLGLASCDGSPAAPGDWTGGETPTDFQLSASRLSLAAGDTFRLHGAAVWNAAPQGAVPILWTSSAPNVASVNSSGLVVAESNGDATITASLGTLTQAATVVVEDDPLQGSNAAGQIVVSPNSAEMAAGDTVRLSASVIDKDGKLMPSSVRVNWSSSAPDIATVDGAGLVRGRRAGQAVIIASRSSATRQAAVAVKSSTSSSPNAPARIVLKPASVDIEAGDTVRITAEVLSNTGAVLTGVAVEWTSSAEQVATVSPSGLIRALAPGEAAVIATAGAVSQVASVAVMAAGAPPPPADEPKSIVLTPSSLELSVQDTASLTATVIGTSGAPIAGLTIAWTTSNANVASVNTSGRVTATGSGAAVVTAAVGSVTKGAAVVVSAPPPPPPPPPSGSEWDRVLADTTINGHVIVPDGQRWLIGRNVQIAGNLRTVNGTIAMRPGSSLRFLGADPEKYVGGGMHYLPEFVNDIGLWVGGHGATGVLDISCTPKQGWNRTGQHATWRADDEYWIAPTAQGDYSPRRWQPGQAIPRIDPRVPAAEVMNITRDCVIEGPGHIHIHSQKPQRIEYVELRGLGVWNSAKGRDTGRYVIHLHMMGNGSRGTVVRGVSAIDSRSHVYVAHTSHGVTMLDLVSVNSFGAGLWWDAGDRTDDFLADGIAVSGAHTPREVSGETSRVDAIVLGSGTNMTIRNSAVSGARGSNLSVGFHWTTTGVHNNPAKWTFDTGNVTHNNQGPGIRFWFNDTGAHLVANAITYRNGAGGIENGAYGNAVRYANVLLVDDHVHHQTSARQNNEGGEVSGYRNVEIRSSSGPALITGHRKLEGESYLEIIDSSLHPAPGHPKVFVSARGETPFRAIFRRSGVVPADIVWETLSGGTDGSHVIIEHEDGRAWDLRVTSGKLSITAR